LDQAALEAEDIASLLRRSADLDLADAIGGDQSQASSRG